MKRGVPAAAILAALIAVVLPVLGLAGCARRAEAPAGLSRSESALPGQAPETDEAERAADSDVPAKEAPGPVAAGLPAARMVIKTASLSVRVKDVPGAFVEAVGVAERRGGFIQASTQYREGGESAEITIRIPPEGFLPLIAALEALGTTEEKSIAGQDVTEEYYDLEAELENQVEVRDRLFQLLRQAKKVDEAIAVEQQLERIGATINRIRGRMKYLQVMVGMSTVTLWLHSEERPDAQPFVNWRMIGHGFFRAAQVLVRALFVVLQVLVVAIPLLAVAAAAAWGVVLLVRLARARGWLDRPRPRTRR
jgi:hypothetical protein